MMCTMANYLTNTVTTTRRQFALALPTNHVEVDKMQSAAVKQWYEDFPAASISDDAITVSVEEGVLVLSWVIPNPPAPSAPPGWRHELSVAWADGWVAHANGVERNPHQ